MSFLRKTGSYTILVTLLTSLIPLGPAFALSTALVSPEKYPGKLDIKNVNGLGKNIATDFFAGAMTFTYPLIFPQGSRGVTPNLTLSYASNNSDAFSPYGYGFSLSLPRVQRSIKKGVSELYNGDEYSAFGSELIRDMNSTGLVYRSKDGSDMNRYSMSGGTWKIETPNGRILTLGSVPESRIADPDNPSHVYAWLLDEERDFFGNRVKYEYDYDGGQPYLTNVLYGYDWYNTDPLYRIHFEYKAKGASLTSYRTQFEITTKKLLSEVQFYVNNEKVRTYRFTYDDIDSTLSHLTRIAEWSGDASLPATTFSYGDAQYQHIIHGIDNGRGGKARFEYRPSTTYLTDSGGIVNTSLPLIVQTLSRSIFEDTVTGMESQETYSYSGGHYYYDPSDIWGREYVGFGEVRVQDEKTRTVLYFHQSQTAPDNPYKLQDHISKKGRLYRSDIYGSETNTLLRQEFTRWEARTIFGERRLIIPKTKLVVEYGSDGSHRDIGVSTQYDNFGNTTQELRHGSVTADLSNGTFVERPGDEITINRAFLNDAVMNIYGFIKSETVLGMNSSMPLETRYAYIKVNNMPLVLYRMVMSIDGLTYNIDRFMYSMRGMLIQKFDGFNNITTYSYDAHSVFMNEMTNPMGWKTRYTFNPRCGNVEGNTDPNGVTLTTYYDAFCRPTDTKRTIGGEETQLKGVVYDDTHIPNSTTTSEYFDTDDMKVTKSYLDGWGRTISTLSSRDIPGQYSVSDLRYDEDGNPIFASYPRSTHSDAFDTNSVLKGVTDGEAYRRELPGVSYQYDALGRIVKQHDARGVTQKSYAPGNETIIDALGNMSQNGYDAFGRLTSVTTYTNNEAMKTQYEYNALSLPVKLIDAKGNIRTWQYDAPGRLKSATDLHAPSDQSFGTRAYTYDRVNNITRFINGNSTQISYSYDALRRPVSEKYGAENRSYQYDVGDHSLGTLSRVSDSQSAVSYTYDALGRKKSETRTIGGKDYTLKYTYNRASILTSIEYPDGGKTFYTYRNSFLKSITYVDAEGGNHPIITDISYAPNSTMQSIRYGNDSIRDITRDPQNNYRLMASTTRDASGTILLDTSYEYDPLSNIIRIDEKGADPLAKSIDYTYDSLSRLTNASYIYRNDGYGREKQSHYSYSYDSIGNISNASAVGEYVYSGDGFQNPNAVSRAGNTSYTYDQAGNTTLRSLGAESISFTYSPYGEMLSSAQGGTTTVYTYDHTRKRILKSTLGMTTHSVTNGYEVEYESGAILHLEQEGSGRTNSGITQTGETNTGNTYSGLTSTGFTHTGYTYSGETNSGETNTGTLNESSGSIFTGSGVSTGETNSGGADTGSTASGTIVSSGSTLSGTGDSGSLHSGTLSPGTLSGEVHMTGTTTTHSGYSPPLGDTPSGTVSGSTNTGSEPSSSGGQAASYTGAIGSGSYIVIAGYIASTLSGAFPVTLETDLTHIMLGDEKIATFQIQKDGTNTPDETLLVFHLGDHLNSASLDLSSTGSILQALDYLPFGKTLTYSVTQSRVKGKKGGYTNKYRFANKELDLETDLQYFEKRYYDPTIGRFTTQDPVFWEVGFTKRPAQYFLDPEQWNTYSYVRNNPINMVDPTGEILDTVVDVGFVSYDVGRAGKNSVEMMYERSRTVFGYFTNNPQLIAESQAAYEQDKAEFGEALLDTAFDGASLLVPGVPAGGSRVARMGQKIEPILKGEARYSKYESEVYHFEKSIKGFKDVKNKLTDIKAIMGPGTAYKLGDKDYSKGGWQKMTGNYITQDKKTIIEYHFMKNAKSDIKDFKPIKSSTRPLR